MCNELKEEYYRILRRIARHQWEIAPHFEKMLRNNDPDAHFALLHKVENMTPAEAEKAKEYLQFGYFNDYNENVRRAAYCVVFDVEYEKELHDQIKSCSEYKGSEPIFKDRIIEEQRDGDLINRPIGDRLPNSNIFKHGDRWGYYDRRIPLEFYDWLEKCFANKPSRIRVEPNGLYEHKPQDLLLECLVVPPKWKWWNTLGSYEGDFNGGEHVLLGNDPSNLTDYQDYHYLNVRKLQTIATRREQKYLSMMLEELSEYNHPTDPNRRYVIGRMIHLDSTALIGTPFTNATLKHIDLAFNLYIDADAGIRMGQTLASGDKVQKATHRTHVLRVEDVPFATVFKFAMSFFRSKYLTNEWLAENFK